MNLPTLEQPAKIHVLPPEVASQIAAGEVIERPASVVKELLENALDAGATTITIVTEGAGQRRIEVADDGTGIPAEQLALAVERHATSKLSQAEDLFHITTLGFRGEALASIGSVARLTITSRPASSQVGARLRVDGGKPAALQPVGAPVGTTVIVEDLFYNVPARLKFLKHPTTERNQIDTLATKYALAYPKVRFTLQQERKVSLQTSGQNNRREVLAALYGVEVARQMLEVVAEDDLLKVHGFISPVSLTRSNRREMTFFVNRRPVQDASLSAALLRAYHTLLMVGRYPMAILFLEMPPDSVDVNVHPTKAEVRFREADRVFSGVQRAVRRALLAHSPVPGVGLENGTQLRWGAQPEAPPTANDRFFALNHPQTSGHSQLDFVRQADPLPTPPRPEPGAVAGGATSARVPILRLVGQVALTYLVAEGPDGLYLIDQHAAHERVLFEKMRNSLQQTAASQSLLKPAIVELPPAGARLLTEQLPLLNKLGYQVEAFGPQAFLVRAVPAILASSEPASGLRALVEDFEEDETPLQAQQEARLVARICKRAAVKAGQALSPVEQRSLLNDLEACQSPRTCPHGRPTMIHLSVDLLERQFGRRGAR